MEITSTSWRSIWTFINLHLSVVYGHLWRLHLHLSVVYGHLWRLHLHLSVVYGHLWRLHLHLSVVCIAIVPCTMDITMRRIMDIYGHYI